MVKKYFFLFTLVTLFFSLTFAKITYPEKEMVTPETEAKLETEILELDLELSLMQLRKEKLEKEIASSSLRLKELQAEEKKLKTQLSKMSAETTPLLLFLYKYGLVSYLEFLLGASDFHEFIIRRHLFTSLLSYQLALISKVKSLAQSTKELGFAVQNERESLEAKEVATAEAISRLGFLQAERKKVLAQAQASLRAFEGECQEMLSALTYFLENFALLPWVGLRPTAVEVEGGGATLRISTEELNRIFAQSSAPWRFEIGVLPDQTVEIRGPGKDPFLLKASLEVAGPWQLAVKPLSLEFQGVRSSAAFLQFSPLVCPLPVIHPALSLKEIRIEAEGLVLFLTSS